MEMYTIKYWEITILTIAFLFSVGCLSGWCLEVFYRRFFSGNNPERKWINPGFMTGPYLPLYGFGLAALYLMSGLPYIGKEAIDKPSTLKVVACILAMGVMMTLIEYIAGLIFIKRMKIKLWDYSDRWGNIQGIICPTFSAIWTAMAGLYYFFIQPHIVKLVYWYYDNVAFTFIVGMFFGIMVVDFSYSMHIGYAVRRFATENGIIVKYEELKMKISDNMEELNEKRQFMIAFATSTPLAEHLKSYAESIKESTVIETIIEKKDHIVENVKEVVSSIKSDDNDEKQPGTEAAPEKTEE